MIKCTLLTAALLALGAPSAPPPAPAPPILAPSTYCRVVPERLDDFAWENDRVAFRAYGPAIVTAHGPENSGVDCWCKRVPYPIINRWYAGDKHGQSYHKDHGEGLDLYDVGSSRGCGGTALWVDGKMVLAGPYVEYNVVSQTPQKSVFELGYNYTLGGRKIHELKRFTIALGQQLYQCEATYTEDGKPLPGLVVAVGVTTHNGLAKATLNPLAGWMSCWETIQGTQLGTGVVIAPSRVVEMRELKVATPDGSHALLLTRADADGKVAFSAGFGWSKAGVIKTQTEWENYLSRAALARG